MRKISAWILLLITFGFLGCTVGPKYKPPQMPVACQWTSAPAKGMNTSSVDCFVWWESLNDPTLNCLMQRAARQNLDLSIAATRILEVRLERKGKSADLLPHIDASVTAGHLYYSREAVENSILKSVPHSSLDRNVNFFEVGFDAEWELDLFGISVHEMCALEAKIGASKASFRDIWITLSAEIARNYIELRGLQQRLKVLCKNIISQMDVIHLTAELVQIGMADKITLSQSQQQLSNLQAQKPLLNLGIEKAIHRISILLAYPPEQLMCELCQPGWLPELPCEKPIGLPSDLLRRRPDIRRAERELAEATEMVGSAVASLFPRISLTGFVGNISTQLNSLLTSGSFTWFAAPQLLMPIFNSRLIMQDIKTNRIRVNRACYNYQKTVLEALEEAENSIAAYRLEDQRNCALNMALQQNREAYNLSKDLYKKGLKNYLDVLVMDGSLLAAEDALIQSKINLLLNYISLYKALGGGWNVCFKPLEG